MAYPQKGKKIYRKEIDFSGFNVLSLKVLFALLSEANEMIKKEELPFTIGIKGGYARLILQECLGVKSPDYLIDMDVDLFIVHGQTLAKSMDEERGGKLLWFVDRLQEIFAGLLTSEDIETVPYKTGSDFEIPDHIRSMLGRRDLTINECVIYFEDGCPFLYYSEQCERDLRSRTAILSTGGNGYRIDGGLIVATPLGLSRLLRFLIEGKVDRVLLPEEFLQVIRQEANGKQPLGIWGILLCRRYRESSELQEKMMKILQSLKLNRGIGSFAEYQKALEREFFEEQGFPFEREVRSFREVLIAKVSKRETGEKRRRESKVSRGECNHPKCYTEFLKGMDIGYRVDICPDCKAFSLYWKESPSEEVKVEDLPSNDVLIKADIDFLPKECFFWA